jgi:hypothetical protein
MNDTSTREHVVLSYHIEEEQDQLFLSVVGNFSRKSDNVE